MGEAVIDCCFVVHFGDFPHPLLHYASALPSVLGAALADHIEQTLRVPKGAAAVRIGTEPLALDLPFFASVPPQTRVVELTTLIATNVISPFIVPLKITLMAAFLVALPIVLYQVWAFVAPGLYSHEKRMVLPLVVSSTVLFIAGVAFCYFFVFGKVFAFIQGFAPKSITAAPDIEAYLSFVMTMFIAFGAAFEVPVVVVVLARMGLVSISKLREFRSYFIVVAFIVAAVITPPDVVSQLALAIPMCLLYEVGIWAAQVFIKHTQAPDAEQQTKADGAA